MSHAPTMRCVCLTCHRFFERQEAIERTDLVQSEFHGTVEIARMIFLGCPTCFGAQVEEVAVCRTCKNALPGDGIDDCEKCFEIAEAHWDVVTQTIRARNERLRQHASAARSVA